ncbi:MAG: hypothetical protein HQ500_09685 [Flavobacteriales bacterium]|nr:hypothetical protein [Flavobacteriales bacterium]
MFTPSRFFIVALLAFLTVSCKETPSGTYRNENIDSDVLSEIRALDAEVHKHLSDGNAEALKRMMSDELKASLDEGIEAFIERAQRTIGEGALVTLDQYHRISSTQNEIVALISGTEKDDDYILQYQAINEQSFVSVLSPKREGDAYLLTTFYGLFDDGWKLNIIQYDRYTISGFSAIQLFRKAEEEYAHGHVVNAFNRMILSQSCSQPAGEFWQFRIQSDMDAFNQKLMEEAKKTYPMPVTIDALPTEPTIFQITPQRVDDQICAMIKYVTQINIKDTLALAAENKALHALCLENYPGVDEDVPFLFYRAFNEMPTQDVSTPYFGFVRPLDERML